MAPVDGFATHKYNVIIQYCDLIVVHYVFLIVGAKLWNTFSRLKQCRFDNCVSAYPNI